MAKYCSNCGHALRETAKFCAECGAAVEGVVTQGQLQQSPQLPQRPQQQNPVPPAHALTGDDHDGIFDQDYASQGYIAPPPPPYHVPPTIPLAPQQAPYLPQTTHQPRYGQHAIVPVRPMTIGGKPVTSSLIVVIILSVLVPVSCGLAALVGSASGGTSGHAAATATLALDQSSPTAFPTISSSPAPASAAIFAPTLGGTAGDFQQQYGPATTEDGLTYDATIAGQPVTIQLDPDNGTQSLDAWAHVKSVIVQVPSDMLDSEQWSAATAKSIAKAFLPADARYQRTTTINPVGNTYVNEYTYISKKMAATFRPDMFINNEGTRAVPAGTISYFCQRFPVATSGYDVCYIIIGVY